jgi:hypothetical protein
MWAPETAPPPKPAPFSSVTHWSWDELCYEGRPLHVNKREAYLRYLDLPARTGEPFELAVTLPGESRAAERDTLESAGWTVTDPWVEVSTPEAYQGFIRRSRAEFCCAKQAYRDLHTGWISDRSAAYMALGRPVLAENTGFEDHVETGCGLLCFDNMEDAEAGVDEVSQHFDQHSRRARELASAYFDSAKVLPVILGC